MLAGFENNSDFDYSYPSSQPHSHAMNRSQNFYGYPSPHPSHQFGVGGQNFPSYSSPYPSQVRQPVSYSSMNYQQEQNSPIAEHVSPLAQNQLEQNKGVRVPYNSISNGNPHPPYSSSPISQTSQAQTAFQYTSYHPQPSSGGNSNSYQQQPTQLVQQMRTNDAISHDQKGSSPNHSNPTYYSPSYQSYTPGNVSPSAYPSPASVPVAPQKSWYKPLISEGMKKLLNSHLNGNADGQQRPKQSYQLLQSLLSGPTSSTVDH